MRGAQLRSNHYSLQQQAIENRRRILISDLHALMDKGNTSDDDTAATDPMAMEGMMNMMKSNMAMMIPQTLIMGWINAFFAGYVISKLIY